MLTAFYEIEIILNSGDTKVEKFTVEHDTKTYMYDMESIDAQTFALKFDELKKLYGNDIAIGNYSVERKLNEATLEDCMRVGGMVCDTCQGFGMRKLDGTNDYKVCDDCKGTGIVKGMADNIIH